MRFDLRYRIVSEFEDLAIVNNNDFLDVIEE